MKLIFSDHQIVDLIIDNSPLGITYQQIYKNLSRVPIPWKFWDNLYYKEKFVYSEIVDRLSDYAQKVSIDLDRLRCLERDQEYFNYIHKIYEKNYNGDPGWLDFHEHIHICENYHQPRENLVCIDYREKSGLLEKPMNPDWLINTRTTVSAGDIYVEWSELGKTPYGYWKNQEPDDLARMCELAKPWLKLRPKIYIALEDINRLQDIERDMFEHWWEKYHADWVKHWGISQWTTENIFGVSVFGKTNQLGLLKEQLKNNVVPIRVSL